LVCIAARSLRRLDLYNAEDRRTHPRYHSFRRNGT
jgi:hypothetical protein